MERSNHLLLQEKRGSLTTWHIWESLAFLGLYFLRVYLLPNNGLYDYDSVRYYQVIEAMHQGSFEDLFHHASPFFNFFFYLIAFISIHYLFLEYVNALLNLLALWLWVDFLWKNHLILCQNRRYKILLFLFAGMSLFQVNSSRYFSSEALSGLLFILFLRTYLKNISFETRRNYFSSVLWLGCCILCNYRAILWIPLLFLAEIFFVRYKLKFRAIFFSILLLLVLASLWMLFGMIGGLAWWKYPAVFIASAFGGENPDWFTLFRADVLYYFFYLLMFEHPLVLPGWLFFIFQRGKGGFRKNAPQPEIILRVFTLLFFIGMSLLLKAPRGLHFVYVLMYGMAFASGIQWMRQSEKTRARLAAIIFAAGVLLQIFYLQVHIYRFASTSYPEAVLFLKQKKIKKILSTASLQCYPFVKRAGIEMQIIFDTKELEKWKTLGYNYVLIDNYGKIANIHQFTPFEKIKPIITWEELSLKAPMLYLEHSEFTGFDFFETIKYRNKIIAQPYQLSLIKLD